MSARKKISSGTVIQSGFDTSHVHPIIVDETVTSKQVAFCIHAQIAGARATRIWLVSAFMYVIECGNQVGKG